MIRVRQVKINILEDKEELLISKVSKILKIKREDILDLKINKKAIDARDKNNIYYVYEVDALVSNEDAILQNNRNKDILESPIERYKWPEKGEKKLQSRIVIVGSGPAGLFCAYILAEMGYKPLIIERGRKVEERTEIVEKFWNTGVLDTECNVQFGEGGAGTFSDGKLNTLIKDKRHLGEFVLETFVKFGAPKEILYEHNPHIGTDILRDVVKNMREYIISKGGEFRYQTKLTDLIIKNNRLEGIIVNEQKKWDCECLVLAIGHSARDTFLMLRNNNLEMEAKAFAVGLRVMHRQEDINMAQYGKFYDKLPNASYKLTYTTKKNRGVYTFCMCPGGYVVNASSEQERLVANGMSNYKRDSGVSNSAVIVTVNNKDFVDDLFGGLEFQRKLEEKAFQLGRGKIPIQLWKDYQANKKSSLLGDILPMIKGEYEFGNLREIFPEEINEAILEAIPNFGLKLKGFDKDDMVMAGVEARSSSPIRIVRNEMLEANIEGVYPSGEGAGYAGGIMTSAIDGIKVAEAIINKYCS